MSSYFEHIAPIRYEGPDSQSELAFKHYDKDRIVLGRRMEDQLRFAVCYWHNFVWTGLDPFGGATFERPWFHGGSPMELARAKADAAFEFFQKLGAPYYCFHDRDVAPEGATPRESQDNFKRIVELLAEKQRATGMKLLWGTANLFSHRRFMSGAASNPDPALFAMAALQVRDAMDATLKLGGENYVLWGGREGYETLLNTRLGQELDQLGRFLSMVVDYKHKIGFKGAILIEPKPREPSKHQYDFDVATVYGFLVRYGLEKEVKVNIEANHATLSGHSFEHEIATAGALGILGSLDMNRGDPQLGWDTDQFPNNVPETALALYHVIQAGGLGSGGLNFDAKVRRQSLDAADLFHGHIGGMDVCAQGLLAAEKMIEDGRLKAAVDARYAGWDTPAGQDILQGRHTLGQLADQVLERNTDVAPVSARQEALENLVNRFCG
ncbi:xylose isomerase [Roseateles saccharophilus]|uniref:Xylose isomerase n=1 Tax=Roseateles saccharophilus TaxID=304 RepID=A0A4R3UYT2_ROSSA|nr:xylose isomerase [Roseateles saccharophilus]MDG0833043.1 xylose isomerase [Roseateles saccharophilus]TCU96241.1 D-xylose isomerase [Roseateles saccharophilus]